MRSTWNSSFTSTIERAGKKEELILLLEKYKGILSAPIVECLN